MEDNAATQKKGSKSSGAKHGGRPQAALPAPVNNSKKLDGARKPKRNMPVHCGAGAAC